MGFDIDFDEIKEKGKQFLGEATQQGGLQMFIRGIRHKFNEFIEEIDIDDLALLIRHDVSIVNNFSADFIYSKTNQTGTTQNVLEWIENGGPDDDKGGIRVWIEQERPEISTTLAALPGGIDWLEREEQRLKQMVKSGQQPPADYVDPRKQDIQEYIQQKQKQQNQEQKQRDKDKNQQQKQTQPQQQKDYTNGENKNIEQNKSENETEKDERLTGDEASVDPIDVGEINGIGQKYRDRLIEDGYQHVQDLVVATPEEIQDVVKTDKDNISTKSTAKWIKKADKKLQKQKNN